MRCVITLLTWVLLVLAPYMASGQDRMIDAVFADRSEVDHPPTLAIDNDFTSRWSADRNAAWIRFDLGTLQAVSQVFIAWYQGDDNTWIFDIDLSEDAVNWTPVVINQTSRMESGMEVYDFTEAMARYVRIIGRGNFTTGAEGISIVEARVHGAPTRETFFPVLLVSTEHIDREEGEKRNTIDGLLATSWSGSSATDDRPWIQFDVGSQVMVDQVFIAWLKGAVRQASYAILVSPDAETWTEVVPDSQSSGRTPGFEANRFEALMVRHVRIVGTNPDVPLALTQVEIHGPATPPEPETVSVFCLYPLKVAFQNLCDQFQEP